MTIVGEFFEQLLHLSLDMGPWLLLGLLAAGLIKALVPTDAIGRWLGGRGLGAVVKAALIGAPLPLCSCSVLPAAITLRRGGASKAATVSFLVATPETGVDSVAVSWALLGPFLTIVRPIAAIISAIFAGLLCGLVERAGRDDDTTPADALSTTNTNSLDSPNNSASDECCSGCGCAAGKASDTATATKTQVTRKPTLAAKLRAGMGYAFTSLWDDLALWVLLALVIAALMGAAIGPDQWRTFGQSGLPAMLAMVAIGIPIYTCATASTPLAAAMLLTGFSPGTVLVFLLAGPATNLGAVVVVRRELGTMTVIMYLTGIAVAAIALGLATDAVATALRIDIRAQIAEPMELPLWLSWGATIILLLCAVRPLRRWFVRRRPTRAPVACPHVAE